MSEELLPIRGFEIGGTRMLYFHWPKTDEMFMLKNTWLHLVVTNIIGQLVVGCDIVSFGTRPKVTVLV